MAMLLSGLVDNMIEDFDGGLSIEACSEVFLVRSKITARLDRSMQLRSRTAKLDKTNATTTRKPKCACFLA